MLPEIFNSKELNKGKPRVLLQKIVESLGIPKDTINAGSFRSWLLRYRANTTVSVGYSSIDVKTETKLPDEVWDSLPSPPEFNTNNEPASILIPVKKQN